MNFTYKNLFIIFLFWITNPLNSILAATDIPEPDTTGPSEDEIKFVEWYYPEKLKNTSKNKLNKKLVYMKISGKAEPDAKIYISRKKIPVIRKDKVFQYPRIRAIVNQKIAVANKEGIFTYILKLPTGSVRLPLTIKYKDKSSEFYQINISITKEKVSIKGKKLTRSPAYLKKFGIWLGGGVNYIRTSQENTTGANTVFASIKLPTYYTKLKATFYKNWDALYTYKISTGKTTSGDGITVNQGDFEWFTHTFEIRWSPTFFRPKIFKNVGQASFRLGGQQHLVPYVIRESLTNANVVENGVSMISLGGQYNEVLSQNWEFEIFMRYQHPINNGDKFDIKSSFAFDGSLGLIFGYQSPWKLGFFWYGQQQGYSISSFDKVDNEAITGKSSWFYSNAEIRVGYTF